MKKDKIFTAEDGKIFNNLKDCLNHENNKNIELTKEKISINQFLKNYLSKK